MNSSRRRFVRSAGLGIVALGLPPAFLLRVAEAQQGKKQKVLVVVFQRGAMDGLNTVIPFKDRAYYAARPNIAIAEPASGDERAIDLDGFYALHPALAPLKEIYANGHLAIVHAAGSPDNTRSHFDAQDYMEIGTPGLKSTPDGWLNRYLTQRSGTSTLRAVAVTAQLPRILAGGAPALTLSSVDEFRLRNEAVAGRWKSSTPTARIRSFAPAAKLCSPLYVSCGASSRRSPPARETTRRGVSQRVWRRSAA